MALPDLSRLASRLDLLRDLGRTLRRLGVSSATASSVAAAAVALPEGQRRPILAFHLRKQRDPRSHALRMFVVHDPVTPDEARAALGDAVEPLLDAGLLERREDGAIVSPFVLGLLDDLYVLADDPAHGAEAVAGVGDSTRALCGAAFPRAAVGRVLDVGCGSGAGALLLARGARAVVGTDSDPRAVALARANVALNELANVEIREGDLFAPVAGETFDRIVSLPPSAARPDGVADASFRHGGRRGDERAIALLGQLPAHLAPGGRAVLHVAWPEHGDASIEQRIRAAVGPAVNLLVLRAPGAGLDASAAAVAACRHPGLGAAFEAEALLRREHFEREGIRDVIPTITVVEPTGGAPGWTATVGTEPLSRVKLTSERIDKIVAARAVAASKDRVFAARLRVPAETTFAQEQIGPGAEVPSTLSARFAPAALLPPIDLTLELLGLVTFVHEADSVREGIEKLSETLGIPLDQATAQGGDAVREALLHGLLELEKA